MKYSTSRQHSSWQLCRKPSAPAAHPTYNRAFVFQQPPLRPAQCCHRKRQWQVLCAQAEDVTETFQDELGDLAAKIEELSKAVDDGLQGTSIFLIGMMGSGKSTTGRTLANVLKYCFFDSDQVIEQATGATVAQVFEANGEEGFRDLEKSVLQELSSYKNCVLATGGGIVVRPANWGHLQVGVTVYLEASPQLLAKRVLAQDGGESRPLIKSANSSTAAVEESLVKLLKERESAYRNADCVVSVDSSERELGASAPEMVLRVLESVHERIKQSAADREARREFTITQADGTPLPDKSNAAQASASDARAAEE